MKSWVVLRGAAGWEALPDDLGLATGMALAWRCPSRARTRCLRAGGVFALWTPLSSPERVINSEHDPATEHTEQRSDEEWKKSNFCMKPETSASMHLLNETR